MNDTDSKIFSLHRYFIWANRMRHHAYEMIEKQGPPPDGKNEKFAWFIGPFMYVSYWFASLYVVIEGWKSLHIKDKEIDELLNSRYLGLLKSYRNGVFHFQKKYHDYRFNDFYDEGEDAIKWANLVHNKLSDFFIRWVEENGIKLSQVKIEDGEIVLELNIKNAKSD